MQRARQRDVVDVVAGCERERSFLTPSGHASVDESWVAFETMVGTEAEPLGHTGTEAFDQRVGLLDQLQHGFDRFRPFEIEGDRAPAAIEQVVLHVHRDAQTGVSRAIDPQYVGAHIRKQHRTHWSGANPGQFDNAIA